MFSPIQVISKLLSTKDYSIIEDNGFTEEYFSPYENEFRYIKEHYDKYGNVPDEVSFLDKFQEFPIQEVTESDKYLKEAISENYMFGQLREVLNKAVEFMNDGDSNAAYEYLQNELRVNIQSNITFEDTPVVKTVNDRIEKYEYVNQNIADAFIPTGFDEIDKDIVGLQRGEELVVIFARTNQGKSWILEAICTHAVEQGYRVGYFSPEMSATDVGYRFDTLHGNISNSDMKYGRVTEEFNADKYREYGKSLEGLSGELLVTSPQNFSRRLTVSKIRQWVKTSELDMVAIDGITYLTDERFKKGDSKTISLTNISEDLMDLSSELKMPVLVVVQANRGGVVDKTSLDTPELENIRDSDGIAMNASKVYSARQVIDARGVINLLIENKKMRTGQMGQSYSYIWDIDRGIFTSIDKADIEVPKTDNFVERGPAKEVTGGRKAGSKKKVEDEF